MQMKPLILKYRPLSQQLIKQFYPAEGRVLTIYDTAAPDEILETVQPSAFTRNAYAPYSDASITHTV